MPTRLPCQAALHNNIDKLGPAPAHRGRIQFLPAICRLHGELNMKAAHAVVGKISRQR